MKRFSGKGRESPNPSGERARLEREAEAEMERVISAANRAAGRPSQQAWSPPPTPPTSPPARVGLPPQASLGPDDDAEGFAEKGFSAEEDEEPLTPEEETFAITEMALHQLADRYGAEPEDYVFEPIDPAAAIRARDAGLARFFDQRAGVRQGSDRPAGPSRRPMSQTRAEAPPSEERWVVGDRSPAPAAKKAQSPSSRAGKPPAAKRAAGSARGAAKAGTPKRAATKAVSAKRGTPKAASAKRGAAQAGSKAAVRKKPSNPPGTGPPG